MHKTEHDFSVFPSKFIWKPANLLSALAAYLLIGLQTGRELCTNPIVDHFHFLKKSINNKTYSWNRVLIYPQTDPAILRSPEAHGTRGPNNLYIKHAF